MAELDVFFKRMVELGASDLHLTSATVPQFRLHGDMVPVPGAKEIYAEEMKQLLFEIAPEQNRQEFEQDGDTGLCLRARGLRAIPFQPLRRSQGPRSRLPPDPFQDPHRG